MLLTQLICASNTISFLHWVNTERIKHLVGLHGIESNVCVKEALDTTVAFK